MEWREQTSVSCMDAFEETKRWIEKVTRKSFGSSNFRAALENGVLLCDLMNKLKPGIIKRLNRLSTPIAGLDNVNVFLKACSKLGLNESQLFHPGDLQDLSTRVTLRSEESNRRLKNVLITVYWLGRRAQLEPFYCGPQLNFKAFEGLLGLTLSKALEEGSGLCPRDGGYGDPEKENLYQVRPAYLRDDSVESGNYLDHHSTHQRSEGCCSDVEADQVFSMSAHKGSAQQQERGCVPPVERAYPPPGDRGYVPPVLLRRKKGREENQGLLTRVSQIQLRPGRPPQVNPGWIWSKSTSDIPMESPGCEEDGKNSGGPDVIRPSRPPYGARSKENEEKWQEDLTKWKNRRRSTNSDLHRKVEERKHEVNETTSGTRATGGQNKTANGDQLSPSVPGPTSSHSSKASHAALSRSYTVETLLRDPWPDNASSSCSPVQNQPLSGAMPASHRPLLGEEVPAASLASDGTSSTTATTPSTCSPPQTLVKLQPSPTAGRTQTRGRGRRATMGPVPYPGIGTVDRTPNSPQVTDRKVTSLHHGPFLQGRDVTQQNNYRAPAGPVAGEEAAGLGKGPTHHSFLYRYNSMSWSGSASLPRGYRRSEGSARLSNVLTARPFGTRPSRKSSLLSTGIDYKTLPLRNDKRQSLQPILNRQVATSLIRAPVQAAEKQEVEIEAGKEREGEEGGRTNGLPYCSDPRSFTTLSETHLPPPANHSAPQRRMRVSLSLTPNSVDDFGFQTDWSATGARVTSVQQGSPAELCQLCVGDVITTLGGAKVEQLSSSQWESTMTSALQSGSLTMDVSRYSNQGCPESHAHKDVLIMPTGPDLHAQGLGIQTRNREFEEPRKTASSKELERIVLRNQRRRAEFFNVKGSAGYSSWVYLCGGTESAISDLQVPSLKPPASNWSWDHEEERKRQERWQEEQERHLQERYQRDQKRMQAEWQSAQEGTGEEPRGTEERPVWPLGNPGVVTPASLTRPVVQRQAPHWEADGSVRGQNEGTGCDGVQYSDPAPIRPQTPADPAAFRPLATETGSTPHSLEAEKDKRAESDFGMSKSTPTLASHHRQTKGPGEEEKKGKVATVSKAEQNRQQILEEMKKRTHLLTDNSWIRQRRASSLKEPLYTGVSLRRYESLDSLHSPPPSSEAPCELSGPRALSGFSGRSVYPRYTTCPTSPDQLTNSPISFSQHLFPDATRLPGKAGSECAVPSISEERDQKLRAETTSRPASVATFSSISSN